MLKPVLFSSSPTARMNLSSLIGLVTHSSMTSESVAPWLKNAWGRPGHVLTGAVSITEGFWVSGTLRRCGSLSGEAPLVAVESRGGVCVMAECSLS